MCRQHATVGCVLLFALSVCAATGTLRLTTADSSDAVSTDVQTIQLFQVGGTNPCTLVTTAPVTAGAVVDIANPCAYDLSTVEYMQVTAGGGDLWMVEQVEVDEGGGFVQWAAASAGGVLSAWVTLTPLKWYRRYTYVARVYTYDMLGSETTDLVSLAFESKSGEVCEAGTTVAWHSDIIMVMQTCSIAGPDVRGVRFTASGADDWVIDKVVLFMQAEEQFITLEMTPPASAAQPGGSVKTGGLAYQANPIWEVPAATVVTASGPLPYSPGTVRTTTGKTNILDSASVDPMQISLVSTAAAECSFGSVSPVVSGDVKDASGACSFGMEVFEYVKVDSVTYTDEWYIGLLEVWDQVNIGGVWRSIWVQCYADQITAWSADAYIEYVTATPKRDIVKFYPLPPITLHIRMDSMLYSQSDSLFTITVDGGAMSCSTKVQSPSGTNYFYIRDCGFGTADVTKVRISGGSDPWKIAEVFLMVLGGKKQGFVTTVTPPVPDGQPDSTEVIWVIGEVTPAPDTPAPDTPAPDTPAPDTPAPDTPAPDTPAPDTPAPDTPAPDTPAPDTPAPDTPAPDTPAPDTPAPDTPAPDTPAPDTPAPDTPAPDTPAPDTPAPDTPAPDTPAPDTPAPDTPAPDTPAPDTPAPDTPAPDTPAPDTPAPDTPAPDTPAPDTPAPDTPAPDTPAPDTPSPVTQPPATPAPDTVVPDTLVPGKTGAPETQPPPTVVPTEIPITPAPDTLVPDTLVPGETKAPETPAPPTATPTDAPTNTPTDAPTDTPTDTPTDAPTDATDTLPPATLSPGNTTAPASPTPTGMPNSTSPATGTPLAAKEPEPPGTLSSKETVQVGATVVAAASVAAGANAGSAMRLVLLTADCSGHVPSAFNPIGLKIHGSETAGAVIADLAITLGFGLLCFLMLQVAMRGGAKVMPKFFEGLDTQGFLRLPSAPLFLFQFFYQGMTLAGMDLMLQPQEGAVDEIIGACCILLCIATPIWVYRQIKKGVPQEAIYARASGRTNPLLRLLIGSGEWVNTTQDQMWVQRYSSVTRTYRQETAWFVGIEFAASFALSAAKSAHTSSLIGCGHVKLANGVIFVILLLLESFLWPHARQRDSVLDVVGLGIQAAAMFFMATAFYNEDAEYWTMGVASSLLLVAMCMLMGRTILDVLTELYLLYSGRRKNLQENILRQLQGCDTEGSNDSPDMHHVYSPADDMPLLTVEEDVPLGADIKDMAISVSPRNRGTARTLDISSERGGRGLDMTSRTEGYTGAEVDSPVDFSLSQSLPSNRKSHAASLHSTAPSTKSPLARSSFATEFKV